MQGKLLKGAALAAVIAALGGGYVFRSRAAASPGSAEVEKPTAGTASVTPSAGARVPDFSAIVQRYGPAVVNLSTTGTVKTSMEGSPLGQIDPGSPFYPFFKRFMPPEGGGQMFTHGQGSGFIVTSDGIILTNAHVVNGASEVKVKLTDRREFTAKVLGIDKAADVAVLKIDTKDLPTVKIGDPARLTVGEWVLAIGSPFGFENTATAGILSARSRSLPGEGYVPFLQTDVAVNPGNSGGPLFNAAGEVIGINSQIFSHSGGYMGLSFAIPIDVAMNVEQQLLAHGKVTRGWLGVTIQEVSQSLGESFGLARPAGALVSSVQKGSPAAEAGIRPGDVIQRVDGKEIVASSDLPALVADLAPGTRVKLGVWRDRGPHEIKVKIGEVKDVAVAAATQDEARRGQLGLEVRPLTPGERHEAGTEGGLLVEGVEGPAARAGIQPGDVILALDGSNVASVEQLRGLATKSGKHVALLVERGEARIFVPIDRG
jgi:serine protease Do